MQIHLLSQPSKAKIQARRKHAPKINGKIYAAEINGTKSISLVNAFCKLPTMLISLDLGPSANF
jgi:hypothetical protein